MKLPEECTSGKACWRLSQRLFAPFLTAVIAIGGAAVSPAQAGDGPIEVLLQSRMRAEWSQKHDGNASRSIRGSEPTLSPNTAENMSRAIRKYSAIVAEGGWQKIPTRATLRLGVRHKNVYLLRKRLQMAGDLDPRASMSDVFDSRLAEAVRRFQERHGIIPDSVVRGATLAALNVPADLRLRQLETNLVRIRSMSGYLGDRYVMVNIPAAEIEAVEAGRVVSRHTAVVGKVDRQTPILASRIHELNFNPFWTVPVSIIRKDLIPKMKEDPQYLARNKIRIFDTRGRELFADQIDWDSDEATKYMFKQDPGKINSLGTVRINFPNPHSVYLHDTPSKSLFGRNERFFSSGCVRVQNVRDLVTWLLRDTKGWTRAEIDATIASGERIDVRLAEPVPLYITYITAWVGSDGIVNFREDIYNRDGLGAIAQN